MSNIMDRWMRESLNALEVMEAQRAEHEAAMEAAMDAIRRHSSTVERLEKHIAILREALEAAAQQEPVTTAEPSPQVAGIASSGAARPLAPPPLRPAPLPRAVEGPRLVAT